MKMFSTESEQSVIGALLIADCWDRVCDLVTTEDFYSGHHKIIFQAITTMQVEGVPVDVVTLMERMEKDHTLAKIGGAQYLVGLSEGTPTAANVEAYAKVVRDRAQMREAVRIAAELRDNVSAQGAIDEAIRQLMAITTANVNHEHTARSAVSQALDDIQAAYDGDVHAVTTGLADVDARIGGLFPSDLVVVGARPSMGKTAFMVNLSLSAGVPAGIISSEQPARQLGARMISIVGGVNAHRMRIGKLRENEWPAVTVGTTDAAAKPIHIYDKAGPDISEVVAHARKMKHHHGIGVLFVDYIQHIRASGTKDTRSRVSTVVMALKDIARDLDIPVVALGQVNRSVEARTNKRPGMADLLESGVIEQEADLIAFLYRDEVYNEDTNDKGIAEIIFEKNRHGPIGTIRTVWIADCMRFVDIAHPAYGLQEAG